jgi:hypothetical protein
MVFCGNSSAAGFKYSTLSDEMGKWDSSGTQALPVLSTQHFLTKWVSGILQELKHCQF